VLGGLVGATLLTVNVVGASGPEPPQGAVRTEVLHTPPLLAHVGDVVPLTFEVVCSPAGDGPGGGCSPRGSLFVRAVGTASFDELELMREQDGRLAAEVPSRYTSGRGFDYYALIDSGGAVPSSLPAGAAEAPQHVWSLPVPTTVDLGIHSFGESTPPSSVVESFAWGKGPAAVGIDSGPEQSRIGPSAFDIAPDGSVVELDQVNRRLLLGGRDPTEMPIVFEGGEGDLAVGRDGTIYVLDDGGAGRGPVVRSYAASGSPLAGVPVAEPVADMVRIGPDGPLVHAYPSEMWFPTGSGRPPTTPADQIAGSRAGRSVPDGRAVVVRASTDEAVFALVEGDRVVHSWRVRSATSLGEVQLAEPYPDGLLVVLRAWDEDHAEFCVLRLTADGLATSFAVDRAEWAETASLSRFRLHGSTLYQLRSTADGVEVAAFEIGGSR
jgi:hypothetical protein